MAHWLLGGESRSADSPTVTESRSGATGWSSGNDGAHRRVRRGGGTIFELTTEVLIFLLRVILLAVLYLFLLAVVLAIRHDAGRAAAAAAPARTARLLVES